MSRLHRSLAPALAALLFGVGGALVAQAPASADAARALVIEGPVFDGQAWREGATLLLGAADDHGVTRIVAVLPLGAELPAGTPREVLSKDHVVLPGLVLAHSTDLVSVPTDVESVTPTTTAGRAHDPFVPRPALERSGVTAYYAVPGTQRFMPGMGSVLSVGAQPRGAIVNEASALHVVFTPEAFDPPAVYRPQTPPGPDNPVIPPERIFPRSRAGALAGLEELIGKAKSSPMPGPGQPLSFNLTPLARVLKGELPLRVRAEREEEIRAALTLQREHGFRLVIEGGTEAWKLVPELVAAGASVVLRGGLTASAPTGRPGVPGARGDANPLGFEMLAQAGIPVALVPASGVDLDEVLLMAAGHRRSAQSKAAKGFGGERALRAITSHAARILGVADHAGCIAAGARADLLVLDRSPFAHGARPVRVMSGGREVYSVATMRAEAAARATEEAAKASDASDHATAAAALRQVEPILIRAKTLHIKGGESLSPGEVLVVDGKIAAVGKSVVAPAGTRVVAAEVLTPGFVAMGGQVGVRTVRSDGQGSLVSGGALGSQDTAKPMSEFFDPALPDVRAVAEAGVTTMALLPGPGAPVAGVASLVKTRPTAGAPHVLREQGALLLDMTPRNLNNTRAVTQAGKTVKSGVAYAKSWKTYSEKKKTFDEEQAKAKKKAADAAPASSQKVVALSKPAPFDPLSGDWSGWIRNAVPGQTSDLEGAFTRDDESGAWVGFFEIPDREPVLSMELEVTPTAQGRASIEVSFRGAKLTVEAELTRDRLRGMRTMGERTFRFELVRIARGDVVAKGAAPKSEEAAAKGGESKGEKADASGDSKQEKAEEKKDEKKDEKKKDDAPKPPKAPKANAGREVWRAIVENEVPVLIKASSASVARSAVELCRSEYDFRTALIGPVDIDAAMRKHLGKFGAGFASDGSGFGYSKTGMPRCEAAKAVADKIPGGFAVGVDADPRSLHAIAAHGVACSMPEEVALSMLTDYPALVLNLRDRVGRIAVGLDADFVFFSGPVFDPATRIERVMIDGHFVDAIKSEVQR